MSPGPSDQLTYFEVLTGAGLGAVTVLRLCGPRALTIASQLFEPRKPPSLECGPIGRPRFGHFAGDEVVALVIDRAKSEVEIHTHGGLAVANAALQLLSAHDVRVAETSHAPLQLEDFLARAETLRVAGILLDQVGGSFEQELAAIDANSDRDRLDLLIARAEIGKRLLTGWRVVLMGRPNVGKSRLLNALAGFDRAIVSPQPGTTRDVVTIRTAVDGWPVEIADTAGIRNESTGVESAGIAKAKQASADADLPLLVLDRSQPLTGEDRHLLASHPHALRVANKCDLPAAWSEADMNAVSVSAETGDGVEHLLNAISQRIVPTPPPKRAVVPFLSSHFALLQIREITPRATLASR